MSDKLTKDDVRKVADLARITKNPDDAFLEKYSKELGSVLEYVKELQEIEVEGIGPTDGIRTITLDELRADEVCNDPEKYQRTRRNIIANFPNHQGGLLILPGIFNE